MSRATSPTYTLAANISTSASTALLKRGSISMKKLLTVFDRLMMPLSMRDWSFPVSFPSAEKNAMRSERMRSTTRSERSRLTRMRIRSPK